MAGFFVYHHEPGASGTLWKPGWITSVDTSSVTISQADWDRLQRRDFLVGVCKCGHTWMMHFHMNNPARPGTSCDEYECKCKTYRLRRVRSLRRRRTLPRR